MTIANFLNWDNMNPLNSKKKTDTESDSDSSECEYVRTIIKPSWKHLYENKNYGPEFPAHLRKKESANTMADIPIEVLNSILQRVRSKQTVKKTTNEPITTTPVQNTTPAQIAHSSTSMTLSEQTNGYIETTPTQVIQSNNPRVYRPMVDISAANLMPSSNINQMPNAYYENPPPSVQMMNHQVSGFNDNTTVPQNVGRLQPQLQNGHYPYPQYDMPSQNMLPINLHPQNMLSPNMSLGHVNMHFPHSNMPFPHSNVSSMSQNIHALNDSPIQRPMDPRLARKITERQEPMPRQFIAMPSTHVKPISTLPPTLQKQVNARRITIDDYKRDRENVVKDLVKPPVELPNRNDIRNDSLQKNIPSSNQNIPQNIDINDNTRNDELDELTFSPTIETPASSPPTPLSNQQIQKEDDDDTNVENAATEEITVKDEVVENDRNPTPNRDVEYDSDTSDATVEFTFEQFRADRISEMAEMDAVIGLKKVEVPSSPQYVIEDVASNCIAHEEVVETEREIHMQRFDVANNELNDCEEESVESNNGDEEGVRSNDDDKESSDSETLSLLAVALPRCYVHLERCDHLLRKFVKTGEAKTNLAINKNGNLRRQLIVFNDYNGSSTETEEDEPLSQPMSNSLTLSSSKSTSSTPCESVAPSASRKSSRPAPNPVIEPEPELVRAEQLLKEQRQKSVNGASTEYLHEEECDGQMSPIVISDDEYVRVYELSDTDED